MSISKQVNKIIESWYILTMELVSDKKEQITDAHNTDESQDHHAERKKTDTKEHMCMLPFA